MFDKSCIYIYLFYVFIIRDSLMLISMRTFILKCPYYQEHQYSDKGKT